MKTPDVLSALDYAVGLLVAAIAMTKIGHDVHAEGDFVGRDKTYFTNENATEWRNEMWWEQQLIKERLREFNDRLNVLIVVLVALFVLAIIVQLRNEDALRSQIKENSTSIQQMLREQQRAR